MHFRSRGEQLEPVVVSRLVSVERRQRKHERDTSVTKFLKLFVVAYFVLVMGGQAFAQNKYN